MLGWTVGCGARLGSIAAILFFLAGPAAAQEPERVPGARPAGDKKEARRRLDEGDRQLRRGDRLAGRGKIEQAFTYFEAALAEYEAAYRAYPDPQIFYPIAQAEQRLGRFVEALQHYQELLAESKALSPELRNKVQLHLDEVRRNLAAVVLEVEPEGATIRVDDKEVGRSPMSQPVFLEPGQHTYSIASDGYETAEGTMDLAPGKETRKRVRLERVRTAPQEERIHSEPRAEPETRARRPNAVALWIGIGVTGALAIGGTVTGFATLSKHGQYEDESRSVSQREAARRDGRQLAGVTDILLGSALVAGGVTAYYYFAVYRPRSRAADAADERGMEGQEALRLAPLFGDRAAGLAVSGTFW